MTSIGKQVCTDVMEIALNDGEERIACTILLYYTTKTNRTHMYRAICTNNYDYVYLLLKTGRYCSDEINII